MTKTQNPQNPIGFKRTLEVNDIDKIYNVNHSEYMWQFKLIG